MRDLLLTLPRFLKRSDNRKNGLVLLLIMLAALLIVASMLKSNNFTGGNGSNKSTALVSTVPDTAAGIPVIQMFVPGFSVKKLPVSLTNINVLRYGPDGKLYALAYDGHIYVLTDTDGDGLEDKVETWWDKNLFVMPVGMVVAKEGIYVTSYNKVSLIKDTDHDGKGDTEEVITKDWVKPFVYTGTSSTGVDAFGIARDKDGNIYFTLGTSDFTRPYSVDSADKSHYNIHSERGTVMKVAPGSSKREIIATGVRFIVSMAFNNEGDLFATDQEGATWLANGNPFDELLQIQTGRHYGFPPRHPKYLPNVIDEPSVFDYKPQHESTCGLNFNLGINGGPVFGPEWWRNDAFVAGYSRGKLYRTKLVKTDAGYVAENVQIGSVDALTVDAAPSPNGDLVVSTHSGVPDWGNGPPGKGALYKIFYTNKQLPNPVAIWASKHDQVKITFDKLVPKTYLYGLADKIDITYGESVGTGDRFEIYRPGYKEVERQQALLRQKLKVKSAELSDDGRTIIINTFSHIDPVSYAIKLPAFAEDTKAPNSIAQAPNIDLLYNLNGVDANWQSATGSEKWSGTIPHLDLGVTNAFTKEYPTNESIKTVLEKAGKVTFKTKLNLWYMLRPLEQPEMTIDYKWPDEDVTLVLKSSARLEVKAGAAIVSASAKSGDAYETKITFNKVEKKAYDLEISMATGAKASLQVHYITNEDSRPRTLQVSRFFVPWVNDIYPAKSKALAEVPELKGGNWSRGKALFYGKAICSSCHSVNGKGGSIGPDLSNLIFRDYKSVMRDIHSPSASINPDYVAHTVKLKDGRVLAGMLTYKKDSLGVSDISGKTMVALKNVTENKAMSTSLMPVGLDAMLGPNNMKDLLTFLLTSLKPTILEFPFIPVRRTWREVAPVLQVPAKQAPALAKSAKPLRILWVDGPKDPKIKANDIWQANKHDYPLQQERWRQLISLANNVNVSKASVWPTPQQFAAADVVIFYSDYPKFSEANGKQLDAFLQRGGGVVYINQALKADNAQALANRTGLAFKPGTSKFKEVPLELTFAQNNQLTKGYTKNTFQDELYWQPVNGSKAVTVLATSNMDGKPQPAIWTTRGPGGKGKVFAVIPGFWDWTFDDPLYRVLLLRGIAWAGNKPVYGYEDIVSMGARVSK